MLTLDIVLHGDGPGERWVRSARPGDKIEGIGPRGKITTSAAADWHLFIGDESALPAMFAMTEALPPGRGHAYLFGQATVVSRLREVLAERGLGQDQMSPKA